MVNKSEDLKRLYCKTCGEVFYISSNSYEQRPWSYCPDCGNEVYKANKTTPKKPSIFPDTESHRWG